MSRPITATLALKKSLPNDPQNTSGLAETWGPVMDANLDAIDAAVATGAHTGTVVLAPTADQNIAGAHALNLSDAGAKLGIGTTTPADSLEIHCVNTYSNGASLYEHGASLGASPTVNFFKSHGTQTSPTGVTNGDALLRIVGTGWDGTGYASGDAGQGVAFIELDATEIWTSAHHGSAWLISSTPNGSVQEESLFLRLGGVNSGFPAIKVTINQPIARFRLADDSGDAAISASKLNLSALSIRANNAAAISAGLVAGDLYRTGADPDVICIVH